MITPPVQISRIDAVKVNLRSENGPFGSTVRVDDKDLSIQRPNPLDHPRWPAIISFRHGGWAFAARLASLPLSEIGERVQRPDPLDNSRPSFRHGGRASPRDFRDQGQQLKL